MRWGCIFRPELLKSLTTVKQCILPLWICGTARYYYPCMLKYIQQQTAVPEVQGSNPGSFCHSALKLDISALLTTFFVWISLQFISSFFIMLIFQVFLYLLFICCCCWDFTWMFPKHYLSGYVSFPFQKLCYVLTFTKCFSKIIILHNL